MGKVMTLVHPCATLEVPAPLLVSKCDLFVDDAGLAAFPYDLKSRVSINDFREFGSAFQGTTVKVTNNNFRALSQLCEESGFQDLAAQLSQFRASDDLKKDTRAQFAIPMRKPTHGGTSVADRVKFMSENTIFECSRLMCVRLLLR
jgi:hypothetical protein